MLHASCILYNMKCSFFLQIISSKCKYKKNGQVDFTDIHMKLDTHISIEDLQMYSAKTNNSNSLADVFMWKLVHTFPDTICKLLAKSVNDL